MWHCHFQLFKLKRARGLFLARLRLYCSGYFVHLFNFPAMDPNLAVVVDAVAGNEDLITEILVRLPPNSLLRFKSVSKTWLRLISSPQLRRRSSRELSKEISGLILAPIYLSESDPDCCDCQFVPLRANGSPPLERLDFAAGQGKLEVMSHCNGLLLCGTHFRLAPSMTRYYCYVFNPTTKEYATVSVNRAFTQSDDGINIPSLCAVSLVFDPRKWLHYKLIFIYEFLSYYFLRIYSSDTGVTREIDRSFLSEHYSPPKHRYTAFHRGVYWNGAVNWLSYHNEGLYFNVEEERFGMLPVLPLFEDVDSDSNQFFERYIVYYGESNDRLHLIQSCNSLSEPMPLQFDVYEMDRGYSGWFMRFHVDLETLYGSLPCRPSFIEMPRGLGGLISWTSHDDRIRFSRFIFLPRGFGVMSVVRRDDDEESFLVVSVPGAVFRYNFEDGSYEKIGKIGKDKLHDWMDSIPFIESLSTVCNSGNT